MSKKKSMYIVSPSNFLLLFFGFRMKVFEAGEKQVLVVKENGKVYAMGAKCTHFGAPLNSGCLFIKLFDMYVVTSDRKCF